MAIPELRGAARRALDRPGWRFGHQTARVRADGSLALEVLLLDTTIGSGEILTATLPPDVTSYPSLTPHIPAAHWAERAIGDFFGLHAEGHPRWKSLILHPPSYAFLEVAGEGVHEIPVGPIHAGIIEPGHFRFSCLGEVVANLEIRLSNCWRWNRRRGRRHCGRWRWRWSGWRTIWATWAHCRAISATARVRRSSRGCVEPRWDWANCCPAAGCSAAS
jgi:hypothetical protein